MADTRQITLSELRVCSYNMYGYNNGLPMANLLCDTHDIVLLQEHWLLNSNLYKLDFINRDFKSYGVSSMNSKSAEGLLLGRPFGGVAILWKNCIDKYIQVVEKDDDNGKYLSVRLRIGTNDIILTCVYFPYYKSTYDYRIDASLIIAHIENIVTSYPDCCHLVAGDYNFQCKNGNPGFDLFCNVARDLNLIVVTV